MSEGPQYTSCVEKEDWQILDLGDPLGTAGTVGWVNVLGAVGAIAAAAAGFGLLGLVLAFTSGAEILRRVAEWLLTGKLICLKNVQRRVFTDPDPDRVCVIGRVLDFEQVGEGKSGFEEIDNDFALNLFIAPFAISDVKKIDHDKLQRMMERSSQGDLIQNPDQPPVVPGDPDPHPGSLGRKDNPLEPFGPMPHGFTGYERDIVFLPNFARPVPLNVYGDPNQLAKLDPKLDQFLKQATAEFAVNFPTTNPNDGFPVIAQRFYELVEKEFGFPETKKARALHCEFEGSRIRDVYNALDFAHPHCAKHGILGFLCDVVSFVIGAVLAIPRLIAAAVAWRSADDGALSNSYDAAGGELTLDSLIVVQGRWCYDSAHSGYNEMHAVRTVRMAVPTVPMDQLRNDWCSQLSIIPPSPPSGLPPSTGLTPAQANTYNAQARDENRWVYHPAIDGCVPSAGTDSPPPPPPGGGLH
jgi:hypothetical protein